MQRVAKAIFHHPLFAAGLVILVLILVMGPGPVLRGAVDGAVGFISRVIPLDREVPVEPGDPARPTIGGGKSEDNPDARPRWGDFD